MSKRYRDNHLGQFTTKQANEANPDGVTAETRRVPDDWSVNDAMVEAAVTASGAIWATRNEWLQGPEDMKVPAMRAALEAAMAVKRDS